jgi:hypothetical protein
VRNDTIDNTFDALERRANKQRCGRSERRHLMRGASVVARTGSGLGALDTLARRATQGELRRQGQG